MAIKTTCWCIKWSRLWEWTRPTRSRSSLWSDRGPPKWKCKSGSQSQVLRTRLSPPVQGCPVSFLLRSLAGTLYFVVCFFFKSTGVLQLMEIGDVQKKDIVDHPENYTLLTTLDEGLSRHAVQPPAGPIPLPQAAAAAAWWRLFTLFQGCGGSLKRREDTWARPLTLSFVRMESGRWSLSSVPGRRKTSAHLSSWVSIDYCCFSTCSAPLQSFKCLFGHRELWGFFLVTLNVLPCVMAQIFKQIWIQVLKKMWTCEGRVLTVNLWMTKKNHT